jgi:hypothetical protein
MPDVAWQSSASWWLYNILAALLSGLVIVVIWRGAFAKRERPMPGLAIPFLLAALFAAIGNIDKIQTLRASLTGGLYLQVRQTIQEAQVTIEQLRRLATTLAGSGLNELALSGDVFTGMTTAEKFRIRDQMVARLKELGVPESEIMDAQRFWIGVYSGILERDFVAAASTLLPSVNVQSEIDQLARTTSKDGRPSPASLRKWVSDHDLHDSHIDELLTNYDTLRTSGRLENPDLIPFGTIPTGPDLEALPRSPQGSNTFNNGGVVSR